VFRIAGLAFPRLLNALCQSRVGPRDGGLKTQRAWGQAGQAPLEEINGWTRHHESAFSGKTHLDAFLSQRFVASGSSSRGASVIAWFGQADLHTPHPKHLVGSIWTLESTDE